MKNINLELANPGGRLYPVSVCLQMVLDFKGEKYQVFEVENMSGHPYGWFYVNQLIAGTGQEVEITPGTELTNSIKIAADNIGYKYTHCETDTWSEMENFIHFELNNNNPIIFGPVSYKHLIYQISAHRATEIASHYIVLVGCNNDIVYFHDSNGMSYVPFTFEELQKSCTAGVVLPGAKRFSAITLKEKISNFSAIEIFKKVIERGVDSYHDKKIRQDGYIGLICLKKYAEDIEKWLGAKTQLQKEIIMRKLGLFFYPKSNQIRADAITYMQIFKKLMPSVSNMINEFCSLFTKACVLYCEGASIITPNLISFDEEKMKSQLSLLKFNALKLYELETKAYEKLKEINIVIKDFQEGGD
ncbi:MAG: C39 family peptidase [Oscillospiraceae bacterium]|nr:C39 family peptidase [Oscillospiraceae bacterium]